MPSPVRLGIPLLVTTLLLGAQASFAQPNADPDLSNLPARLNKLSKQVLRLWAGENELQHTAGSQATKAELVEALLAQAREMATEAPYDWEDASQSLTWFAAGGKTTLVGNVVKASRHSFTLDRTRKAGGMVEVANSLALPRSFVLAMRDLEQVTLSALATQGDDGMEYRLLALRSLRLQQGAGFGRGLLPDSLVALMGKRVLRRIKYQALVPKEKGTKALAARIRVALGKVDDEGAARGVWSSLGYHPPGTLGWVEEVQGWLYFTPDGERFGFELPDSTPLNPDLDALKKARSKAERERRRILSLLAENGDAVLEFLGEDLGVETRRELLAEAETHPLTELQELEEILAQIAANGEGSGLEGVLGGLSVGSEE